MSISNFRMRKLTYVFNVFFDVNSSGSIDKKDFEIAIQKICQMRGWKPTDNEYRKTHECLLRIWNGLKQKADSNKDDQISIDEWCHMWDAYAKDPSQALEWQNLYMKFMFDLEDASNDGSIDIKEFVSVCSCYGIDEKECCDAFNKMNNGKEITFEGFQKLWVDFFVSEDPNCPGNFIFGKTKF